MVSSSQLDGVRALAVPAVASAGLVLEDLTVAPAGRRRVLRVTVDLPEDSLGGVPLDAVAAASQALSAALDASEVMGDVPYVLEVSSPGVGRPLTERRHWSRARRRLIRVDLVGGGSRHGRLEAVDDDGVVVAGQSLAWAQIRGGRVEVDFAGGPDGDQDDTDHEGDA